MKTTVATRQGLTVSETTALFVDAIKMYDEVKDKLIEALTALYGEARATSLYNEEMADKLEVVDQIIAANLALSIRDNIGNNGLEQI